jgi:hypothetical protein
LYIQVHKILPFTLYFCTLNVQDTVRRLFAAKEPNLCTCWRIEKRNPRHPFPCPKLNGNDDWVLAPEKTRLWAEMYKKMFEEIEAVWEVVVVNEVPALTINDSIEDAVNAAKLALLLAGEDVE